MAERDASYNLPLYNEARYNQDPTEYVDTIAVCTFGIYDTLYIANEVLDVVVRSGASVEIEYSKFLDLLQLIPEKFRGSIILQDYLYEVGILTGAWLSEIDELKYLLDPYSVEEEWIQNLADLLGVTLSEAEDATIEERRRQLIQTVDFYKLKGTYQSLEVVMYLLGKHIEIYDMYTDDYATFVQEEWFVGNEGENPPGLNSSYYKSPHFGLAARLNRVYESGSAQYLWQEGMFTEIAAKVETIRPINTVPHYILDLKPITTESGDVYTVDGDIKTKVMIDWEFVRLYLDMGSLGSGQEWYLDDGKHLDWSKDAFLDTITKWKLGVGNKGVSPGESGFAMASVILSGSITSKTIYDDRIEFVFTIGPGTIQAGISELGLFLDDNTTLVIASTFPDIDLETVATLQVTVVLYK